MLDSCFANLSIAAWKRRTIKDLKVDCVNTTFKTTFDEYLAPPMRNDFWPWTDGRCSHGIAVRRIGLINRSFYRGVPPAAVCIASIDTPISMTSGCHQINARSRLQVDLRFIAAVCSLIAQ